MAKIQQTNPFLEVKQRTNRDVRQLGPLVTQFYEAESTAAQTIINLSFAVEQTDEGKKQIELFVDGKLLREGASNDYVYTNIYAGQSSQITLNFPLSAGLNIICKRVGSSVQNFPNPSSVQASVNQIRSELDIHDNANGIINGSFDFWQRGTSFASITLGTYSADRWRYAKDITSAVHTVSRSTDVPSSAFGQYSMLIDCTTADASVAAGDYVLVEQLIEGNLFRKFKGKDIVLKFWVKATKTGINCISFQNSNSSRSIVKEYTINQSDTWEQKTIRFSHNTTGTWLYDTGTGMRVRFTLMAGSTYHGSADVWHSANYIATVNQVNNCDSVSNNFQLADVHFCLDNEQLDKDPQFRLAGRDLAEELQLCERYYQTNPANVAHSFYANAAGNYRPYIMSFRNIMRIAPVVSISPSGLAGVTTSVNVESITDRFFSHIWATSGAGLAVANIGNYTANAEL